MVAGLKGLESEPTSGTAAKRHGRANQIEDAARQFEALLIAQMLKTARAAGSGGWLGTGDEDQAGASALEIAEEQFAAVLAEQGGLGLAGLVARGLDDKR